MIARSRRDSVQARATHDRCQPSANQLVSYTVEARSRLRQCPANVDLSDDSCISGIDSICPSTWSSDPSKPISQSRSPGHSYQSDGIDDSRSASRPNNHVDAPIAASSRALTVSSLEELRPRIASAILVDRVPLYGTEECHVALKTDVASKSSRRSSDQLKTLVDDLNSIDRPAAFDQGSHATSIQIAESSSFCL